MNSITSSPCLQAMDDSLFRPAFESSDYGVIFLNADEKIVFWNNWIADKSNINISDALGKSLLDLFPDIAEKRISGAISRALSGASTVLSAALNKPILPLFERQDNGEKQPLLQSVSVRPFDATDGAIFCMVQIHDVTAVIRRDALLKQYVEKAQGLSQLKSEFIATVSHELRTPLTSINGSLSILSSGVVAGLSAEAKTLIDVALNNTDRLILLINDILDIEKIEAGRMDFNLGPIQLIKVIEQSIECNKPYGDKYQVTFRLVNEAGKVTVFADTDRLMQVMSNLLSNASKFSTTESQVKIIISRVNAFIRISIKDTGPGVPKSFEGSIFEKFSQADGSDRREKGGTGLGLSICKSIMERMSGHISFTNNPEGGASFHIDLKEITD